MLIRVIITAVTACLFANAYAPDSWEFSIGPSASVRSPVFPLAAGAGLRLAVGAGSNLLLDVFVYNADTKELAGKSDDEAVEPYYAWRALETGRYYVVIRNASEQGGTGQVYVLPVDKARSAGAVKAPDVAVVNVFYATDRAVTGHGGKGTTYGTEPTEDEHLEFGVAKVSIPRAHLMGELEGKSILRLEFSEDPEKHIILQSATPEQPDSFFKRVSERVEQSDRREAFVFVHGFNVPFEEAARRTAQMAYDLGFQGAAILYSWPSQGGLGLVDYNKDGQNADLSVPHFRNFLSQLAARTNVRTIHVIAHSMGNRIVVKALAEGAITAPGRPLQIREVALFAPDIAATEFRRLAAALQKGAGRVTLYASSGDSALKASEKLMGYPRAGEGGEHIVVMPGVIDTIDASSVDTSMLGLGHSYYADSRAILSDLFHLIRGDGPRDRFGLIQHGQYWLFAPVAR